MPAEGKGSPFGRGRGPRAASSRSARPRAQAARQARGKCAFMHARTRTQAHEWRYASLHSSIHANTEVHIHTHTVAFRRTHRINPSTPASRPETKGGARIVPPALMKTITSLLLPRGDAGVISPGLCGAEMLPWKSRNYLRLSSVSSTYLFFMYQNEFSFIIFYEEPSPGGRLKGGEQKRAFKCPLAAGNGGRPRCLRLTKRVPMKTQFLASSP